MDWIKRNWIFVAILGYAAALVASGVGAGLAHGQKPESSHLNFAAEEPYVYWGKNLADPDCVSRYGANFCGAMPLRIWVEQHCVAVLIEKQLVHHKLGPSGAGFDDRTEWDEQVPEQTLKLRCK